MPVIDDAPNRHFATRHVAPRKRVHGEEPKLGIDVESQQPFVRLLAERRDIGAHGLPPVHHVPRAKECVRPNVVRIGFYTATTPASELVWGLAGQTSLRGGSQPSRSGSVRIGYRSVQVNQMSDSRPFASLD